MRSGQVLKLIYRSSLAATLLVFLAVAGTGCVGKKNPAPEAAATTGPAVAAPSPTPAAKKPAQPKTLPDLVTFGLFSKVFPKKAEPPKAQAATQVGTIKLVNAGDHFVLIDSLVYQAGGAGDTLVAIADGKQTGTLKVSTLRKPPFLIADIVDGSPNRGDKVYKGGQPTGTH